MQTKPAAPATRSPKSSNKTHRRSRTGCFTCRLRRKKCDEGKPLCKACKHLGLTCEYKRPHWWGNVEQRKHQKEAIKVLIKRTKMTEKINAISPLNSIIRQRALSIDSGYSLEYEYADDNPYEQITDFGHPPSIPPYHTFHPFGLDVKTEKQTFINTVPMRRNSTQSSLDSFHSLPGEPMLRESTISTLGSNSDTSYTSASDSSWDHSGNCSGNEELDTYGLVDFNFDPNVAAAPPISVDEKDRQLLDHFLEQVVRLIFPVLETNPRRSAKHEVVLPALARNKTYLHCCLSISALHLKSTLGLSGDVDQDIMRHRYATVSELCEELKRDTNHLQILEATLGMILFPCSVGHAEDALPDIPWHGHFQAVTSLVQKLDLTNAVFTPNAPLDASSFNLAITSWIDIMGATMRGKAPVFAHTYRERCLNDINTGLSELMGCDDRVMYLMSEICCLENLKDTGLEPDTLCTHIGYLAKQIDDTERRESVHQGHFIPHQKQISHLVTSAFRLASRIYLCSLVPQFSRNAPDIRDLVNRIVSCLEQLPVGPDGYDKSLTWVFLIAGWVATPDSLFRPFLQARIDMLGESSMHGSFGRMARIVGEVWQRQTTEKSETHWRTVMAEKGWDFLLL